MTEPNQRDTVGETRRLVAEVSTTYQKLSDPQELEPSVNPRRDHTSGAEKRRGNGASPPAPVDMDVLDWLLTAERVVFTVAQEVTAAATGDPHPQLWRRWHTTPEGHTEASADLVYERPPRVGARVPDALSAIAEALDEVPYEVEVETAVRMWELARGGARLLGTGEPMQVRWKCPKCGRRSAMTRPGSDGREVTCVHRGCRATFTMTETLEAQ